MLARLKAAPAELDMEQALARIEAHLLNAPDDGQGFDLVAPIYLRIGRTDDALRAYANAIRLLGATPERLDSYGEAIIAGAGDVVTAQAKAQFAEALKLAPADPKAQFFLGVAAEQEGDKSGARAIFENLVASSPPDAPWVRRVKARMAALDGGPAARSPAPSGDTAQQIASLPAGQQQAAIRGMVDGLATRLSQNGQDLPGWLRLVRAYAVLNEPDKARAALGEARKAFASDTDALRALDGLGRDLGLGG